MSKGKPFVALRLAHDVQDRLRERAAQSAITLSDIVRLAVARYLSEAPPPSLPDKERPRRTRPPSRPQRLQSTINELEILLSDYQTWSDNQPEFLQDSPTASALAETVQYLEDALDSLHAITPPRGYGRDY